MQALADQGVRYCHWKSNLRLAVSLMDALTSTCWSTGAMPSDSAHCCSNTTSSWCWPLPANAIRDSKTSGLRRRERSHVPSARPLSTVLGEQFVKNYRLPLEERFLASARLLDGVMVPAPELELIVLTLRALLKYRDRDVVKDVLTIRSPGIPEPNLGGGALPPLPDDDGTSRARLGATAVAVLADVVQRKALRLLTMLRAGYRLFGLAARQALRPLQRTSRLHASMDLPTELWSRRNTFLPFCAARRMTSCSGRPASLVGATGQANPRCQPCWRVARLEAERTRPLPRQQTAVAPQPGALYRLSHGAGSQRHAGQCRKEAPKSVGLSADDCSASTTSPSAGSQRSLPGRYETGRCQAHRPLRPLSA